MKFFVFFSCLFLLVACQSKNSKGGKFLGKWVREEKMHPVRYYVTTYNIAQNGESYKVDVNIDCHACETIPPVKNTFSGSYNDVKDVFELQREGFPEILMIDDKTNKMVSDRKPEYQFIKKE
jgi:hypothetical protein